MKKILFVLLIALCGVSFGKPTNSSDSTEVLAVEPVPEAANPVVPVDCANCDYPSPAGGYVPDFIIEECIDDCMNK